MGGSVSEEYGGSGGDIGFDSKLFEQSRTGDASGVMVFNQSLFIISHLMEVMIKKQNGYRN